MLKLEQSYLTYTGGSPVHDRVLATQFGVHAAQLINGTYGVTVAFEAIK